MVTTPPPPIRARGPRTPAEDAVFRARRRERRLREEIAVRAGVCLLFLLFHEALDIGTSPAADPVIRAAAILGLLLNAPYYLAARLGRHPRAQAYARMLIDVALLTAGLYAAGGLAAAPYVAVYTIVPVYAGTVLSGTACPVATAAAAAGYLAVVLLQRAGALAPTGIPGPTDAAEAAFNLMVLGVVGTLTAILSEAYRQSRKRLGALYQELERAYDESSKLNAEIQRSARLHVLGEVVAGVTHEIGNALQGGVLALELARAKAQEGATDLSRELDRADYACATAMRIVRNVLHTARQSVDEKVAVSLADVARRTVGLKGYDLRRAGIVVQLDFPRDFPLVLGNPFRLQQVLLNLVTNAQEVLLAGRGPRVIAIVGSSAEGRATVEVQDTGPGIPEEALTRIFEPFYTTKPQGTGLGLAISADIVRDGGGQLSARNRAEGGAAFRLTLPIAAVAGVAAGSSPALVPPKGVGAVRRSP